MMMGKICVDSQFSLHFQHLDGGKDWDMKMEEGAKDFFHPILLNILIDYKYNFLAFKYNFLAYFL